MGLPKISKDFVEKSFQLISELHNAIINTSGGEHGIRDDGGLYNSVYKILRYQENNNNDPVSVGAFVYKEIARRHHFNDGNKRTAHTYAKVVLYLMSYHLKVEYKNATPFIIKIAEYQSQVTFAEIKMWIEKNLVKISDEDIAKYLKEIILETKHAKQK